MHTSNNNNNTQEAAIALLPLTTHPQSWAEPHIHVHTGKSLPSVPPSPEEQLTILNSSQLQILSQGLKLTRAHTLVIVLVSLGYVDLEGQLS